MGDFHSPPIGDGLRLAGVVCGGFEVVLEQELSFHRHLRMGVGDGTGDGESQYDLNETSFGCGIHGCMGCAPALVEQLKSRPVHREICRTNWQRKMFFSKSTGRKNVQTILDPCLPYHKNF